MRGGSKNAGKIYDFKSIEDTERFLSPMVAPGDVE
jgi:hypothetical protein